MRLDLPRSLLMALIAILGPATASRGGYNVTNLVSDVAGLAANTDANFRNPWGVSYAPTGPFWVSDQATNLSTLYNGAGTKQALTVSIPTAASPPNGPTGQVFNGIAGDFTLSNGNAATFLFANLNGQISGWNGGAGTVAQTKVSGTGATYTGLAIAQVGAHNVLFAADARGGKIDVYDNAFNNISTGGGSYAGKFADANLTGAGFKIFNVQTIGSEVYVTYNSRSNGGNAAISGGAVAVYDLNGNLLRDFSNGAGGPMEDPWGVALAPSTFGQFANALLIGSKEAGTISAFDPTSGAYLGLVATITNDPTSTNNGLWALTFGNGKAGGDANTLYAFAGINNEVDGLMAAVTPAPEPSSIVMTVLGGAIALATSHRRRRRSIPA